MFYYLLSPYRIVIYVLFNCSNLLFLCFVFYLMFPILLLFQNIPKNDITNYTPKLTIITNNDIVSIMFITFEFSNELPFFSLK